MGKQQSGNYASLDDLLNLTSQSTEPKVESKVVPEKKSLN
jgi:hypothetical protein